MTPHEQYQERLRAFNSTEKYKSETDFLLNIMKPHRSERVLDYGCGLGRLVHRIRDEYGALSYGYDVNSYQEKGGEELFRRDYHFRFHKAYFMHSISHVPDIEQKLIDLRNVFLLTEARVYVITPNLNWLKEFEFNPNYKPDPTVVEYFSPWGLADLFERCGYSVLNSGQFGVPDMAGNNERLFLEAQWK